MNLFAYLSDPANWQGPGGIWYLLLQHIAYTVASVGIAAVVGIPLGILIGHTNRGSFLVIGLSNAARAIPSLGLLVLVVLLLGTGVGPIIGVLAVLALPPILTATAAGIHGADQRCRARSPRVGHVGTPNRGQSRVAARLASGDLRAAKRSLCKSWRRQRSLPTVAAVALGGCSSAETPHVTIPKCSPAPFLLPCWLLSWMCCLVRLAGSPAGMPTPRVRDQRGSSDPRST